jgi:hypothetical protein
LLSRLVLIPVVAGISYELLKLSAKYYERSGLVRALVAPGLALQQLTTREPDAGMLEVSIASLKQVLASEGLADEGLADEGLTDEGLTDEGLADEGALAVEGGGQTVADPGPAVAPDLAAGGAALDGEAAGQ